MMIHYFINPKWAYIGSYNFDIIHINSPLPNCSDFALLTAGNEALLSLLLTLNKVLTVSFHHRITCINIIATASGMHQC